MKTNLYCINDKIAGSNQVFLEPREKVAVREFSYNVANAKNALLVRDVQLVKLGTFDTNTMDIELLPVPLVVIDGEQAINNYHKGMYTPKDV